MKIKFVEAHYNIDLLMPQNVLDKLKEFSKKFGKRIGLVTTVQHWLKLNELKDQLKNEGFEVFTSIGSRAKHEGQILGCDVAAAINIKDKVDFFIYVGTGRFHPIAVSVFTDKPILKYDPFSKNIKELETAEVSSYKKHVRAGQVMFLDSNRIGILMSEKSGQKNFNLAMRLKDMIEKKEKKAYILAFDTLDFSQLENFPFIDCFVNTACPRLIDDYSKFPKPIVNASDIISFLTN